jgi:hypothetical protein
MKWFCRKSRNPCEDLYYQSVSPRKYESLHICGLAKNHFGSHLCADRNCFFAWYHPAPPPHQSAESAQR